jgi:hypothetical protein
MRARLKTFLPMVLVALAIQILAPILAYCAASNGASDPLVGAVICHGCGRAGAGPTNQTGSEDGPRNCCALCGVLQTAAPLDPPPTAASFSLERQLTSVAWNEISIGAATPRSGSPEQARAPPPLT